MTGDELRQEIASERRDLLNHVNALRLAVAELRPNEMRSKRLPSALQEIGVIVETTEAAANEIMGAVEEIMQQPSDMSAEDYRAAVEERCIAVMTACSFQDLTGQRINKVVELLLKLEVKLAGLAEALGEDHELPEHAGEVDGDGELLNGPALPGEGADQSEIDRLFA